MTYIIIVPAKRRVNPSMFAGRADALAVAYCLNCRAPALRIWFRASAERIGDAIVTEVGKVKWCMACGKGTGCFSYTRMGEGGREQGYRVCKYLLLYHGAKEKSNSQSCYYFKVEVCEG